MAGEHLRCSGCTPRSASHVSIVCRRVLGVAPSTPASWQTVFQARLDAAGLALEVRGTADTRFFSAIGTLYLMSLPSIPSTHGRTALAIGTMARRFRLWTRPGWLGSIRFRLRSMFASVELQNGFGATRGAKLDDNEAD